MVHQEMNVITVFGRCTKDPRVIYREDEQPMIEFFIADNDYDGKKIIVDGKEKKPVNFFRCVAFGVRAEKLGNVLGKGVGVMVSGRLTKSEYQGKDGIKRMQDDILVDKFEFTDRKEKVAETPQTN